MNMSNNKSLKLKDLLQWEVPEVTTRYGEPTAWVLRTKAGAYKGKDYNYKFAVNRVWLRENEKELYDRCANSPSKTIDVGISMSFDRPNKTVIVVFDPPKDMPQWIAKLNQDKSGTITVSNKRLGEDLFDTFGIPSTKYESIKQFLNTEVSKKYPLVEGHKVYEFTYSQGSLQNVAERQKQMKQLEKSKSKE
jgi:hypothetical protein